MFKLLLNFSLAISTAIPLIFGSAGLPNNTYQAFAAPDIITGGTDKFKEAIESIKTNYESFMDFVRAHQGESGSLGEQAKNYIEKSFKGPFNKFVIDSYVSGGFDFDKTAELIEIDQTTYDIGKSMYSFFMPLGIIMVIIYMLLDLMNISTSHMRDLDTKAIVMPLLKGMIGLALLRYGYWIMGGLVNVANTIALKIKSGEVINVSASSASMDTFYETILTQIGSAGIMESLGFVMTALILQCTQIIPQILIMFHAISRKIEIIFRVGIAPISLPDIYNGISNSKALTFLKRFAVCLLHGPMMIIILKVAFYLQSTHVADIIAENGGQVPGLDVMLEMGLYGFAAAGLVASCKSALNDAVGC